MIEIGEEKYWRWMNYHDGLLYLSLLEIEGKNDWRMIENVIELNGLCIQSVPCHYPTCWLIKDCILPEEHLQHNHWVIPVRDI